MGLAKVIGTVVATMLATGGVLGGIFYAVDSSEGRPESQLDQVTEMGQGFDNWFLANPANDTIFPKGEDYSRIVQETLNEEPAKGLEEKKVYYFSRGEANDYALCVAEDRDPPTEEGDSVYVYFSQSKQTMLHDRCTIENLLYPENEVDDAEGIDSTRR